MLGPLREIAAERERRKLESEGVDRALLERCADEGLDRTRLAGLLKAYVPLRERPASARPFGFVFRSGRGTGQTVVELLAFGERNPPRNPIRVRAGAYAVGMSVLSGRCDGSAVNHRDPTGGALP